MAENRKVAERLPKLRAQRRPPNRAIREDTIVAFFRLIRFSSQKNVMEISLMDIVEVSEARKRRRKNKVDHTTPPGS